MKPTQEGLKNIYEKLTPNIDRQFVIKDKPFSIFNLEHKQYSEFSTLDITVIHERKVMVVRVFSNRMSIGTHGVVGNIYLKKRDFDNIDNVIDRINKSIHKHILENYFE